MKVTSLNNFKKYNFENILILIFLACLILFLRNPEPFKHLILYAEDGVWIGEGLTVGWINVLINAREDYFVTFNIFLLYLSTVLSNFVSGSPIGFLPESVSIVSFLFFSTVATLIFFTIKDITNKFFAYVAYFCMLLLPLGDTQNEIIGRILQVGFFMPVFAVMLLYWREKSVNKVQAFIIDFLIIVAVATNPFVFAVVGVYFALELFGKKSFREIFINHLFLIMFLTVFFFVTIVRLSAHGGISDGFNPQSLVEVTLGRTIAYTFFFYIYNELTDFYSIIISFVYFSFVVFSFFRAESYKLRWFILFLFFVLVLLVVATILLRPGLTLFFNGYSTTFPDRYFMGINALVMLLFVVSSFSFYSHKFGKYISVISLLILSFLYLPNMFKETLASSLPLNSLGIDYYKQLNDYINKKDGVEAIDSHFPVEPKGWLMRLPLDPKILNKYESVNFNTYESYGFSSKKLASGITESLNHLQFFDGVYFVKGYDPYIVLKIVPYWKSNYDDSNDTVDFVSFDFRCHQTKVNPMLQFFWWSKGFGAVEEKSITFRADKALNQVIDLRGMDLPRLGLLGGFRIDLANPSECSSFIFDNFSSFSAE